MIRHTVLFGWNEHARDEDKKRAFDELATLPFGGFRGVDPRASTEEPGNVSLS